MYIKSISQKKETIYIGVNIKYRNIFLLFTNISAVFHNLLQCVNTLTHTASNYYLDTRKSIT